MKTEPNGNGDGKEPAKIEERGEAIPWMPEGWWSPTQCIDRTGRQITVWRCARGAEGADETLQPQIFIGHGTRAEKFPEGLVMQPLEFQIEGVKTFEEAAAKYDADLAEAGERVGEAMRKEYTRSKLMVPPGAGGPQGHSGTFRRLNQRPRF